MRAYAKPGTNKAFYCDGCDEYHKANSEWTERRLYRTDGYSYSDGDDDFYTETVEYDAVICDCCNRIIALDGDPDTEDREIWVCGECTTEHDEEEEAVECCT